MPFLILETIISQSKGVRKGDHTDHLDTYPIRTLTMIDCLKYSFNKVSFLILHSFISILKPLPLIQSTRSIHITPPMMTIKKKKTIQNNNPSISPTIKENRNPHFPDSHPFQRLDSLNAA